MKYYTVYLADRDNHTIVAQIRVKCDGYLTALAEAANISKNHDNTYVARVL